MITEKEKQEVIKIMDFHKQMIGIDTKKVEHLMRKVELIDVDGLSRIDAYIVKDTIIDDAKEIIAKVEEVTNIPFEFMVGINRSRNFAVARQYAMYQVHKELYSKGMTWVEIGRMFNKTYSTAMHSVRKIANDLNWKDPMVMSIDKRYNEL